MSRNSPINSPQNAKTFKPKSLVFNCPRFFLYLDLSMEFWGVEVKAGETVKCEPGEERLLHLSHAALGETKNKGAENVQIYVKFNEQKLVLGTLSAEKCAQISYDLVFEKEFELSHGSKNASVYFSGYKTDLPQDDEFPSDFDESDSEEDVPVAQNAKGALKVKSQEEKPAALKFKSQEEKPAKASSEAGKPAKAELKSGDDEDDEDDSDFEDDDDDSEGSDDDVVMEDNVGDEDSDDDDDDDDDDESSEEEEDEETPKKSANGKKRPAEAALKTSATGKKGDGKKGIPAKQSGKAQANSDKPKQQVPKSAGTPTMFSRPFEKAPKKAKHGKGAK